MSKPQKPTEAELAILQVLWQKQKATVREVNEVLNAERPTGYTTTLKLMQIMHEKGFLSREKKGRTHTYRPEVRQEDTQKRMVNRLVDRLFGGSALKLVQQALGGAATSPEEIAEIRRYLDEVEKQQNQEGGKS
jgi:predicted transcriptional regulator